MSNQDDHQLAKLKKAADVPHAVASVFPDGEAVAALFTDDASFVVGDGTVLDGRSAIVAYFERMLEGGDKSGVSLRGVRSVARFDREWQLSTELVVVRSRGGLIMPGERDVARERQAIQTWVIVRRGEAWLAAAYQNTRAAQY